MKFTHFRVMNFRNVVDSGDIPVNQITAFVGQNECGKSNLFEALYRVNPYLEDEEYDITDDWPHDDWGGKDPDAIVCEALFVLDQKDEIEDFFSFVNRTEGSDHDLDDATKIEESKTAKKVKSNRKSSLPKEISIVVSRSYDSMPTFRLLHDDDELDAQRVHQWSAAYLPKFVFVSDYPEIETTTDLLQLRDRYIAAGSDLTNLAAKDQTIMIILELAKIDLEDLIKKAETEEGRTERTFDTVYASAYLSKQFQELWRQKKVDFQISVDGTTLNILSKDHNSHMPVKLQNRSTGFKWHIAFAWRFTHATQGQYADCVLLLEEPGIHLHFDGQRDLLEVFERLAENNSILYTTHLPSMLDPAFPERVRIVESHENHAKAIQSVVSNQKQPMAVVESRLGLTGSLSSMLGNRQNLIVEGGYDELVLSKLSGILGRSGRVNLSESIYLWAADGASQTPMYAAFTIGQKWPSAVLLDSDEEGDTAEKRIKENSLNEPRSRELGFHILRLKSAAGINKTDAAIEDLFPDEFYIECVNEAYNFAITEADLPKDGSDMITKRIEAVLIDRHSLKKLDKRRVLSVIMKRFDDWKTADDLPDGAADRAETLFKKINSVFSKMPPMKLDESDVEGSVKMPA